MRSINYNSYERSEMTKEHLKSLFPNCKIIEDKNVYQIYAMADSVFHFHVVNMRKTNGYFGHKEESKCPQGFYSIHIEFKGSYNTVETNPFALWNYIETILNQPGRTQYPAFVFVKKNDKDDLCMMIRTVYQAYVEFLNDCEIREQELREKFTEEGAVPEPIGKIEITLNEESVSAYADKLMKIVA